MIEPGSERRTSEHLCLLAIVYLGCVCVCVTFGLLEIVYSIWCCWDVVSSHVLMHFRETLLDVVLCTALPHCGKAESLRGMVQLQESRKKLRWFFLKCCQKILILILVFFICLLFLFFWWVIGILEFPDVKGTLMQNFTYLCLKYFRVFKLFNDWESCWIDKRNGLRINWVFFSCTLYERGLT